MNSLKAAMSVATEVRNMITRMAPKAKSPREHSQIIRKILELHDKLIEQTVLDGKITIACRQGCSFCCYLQVDAKAHEILFLAQFLRERLGKAELFELTERCRIHRSRVMGQTLIERQSTNNCCPLLADNACMAYAVRPITCRNYHAKDVNRCMEMFAAPEIHHAGQGTEDLQLKGVGALLWVSCSNAYAQLGYDARSYDLGSALYEALTSVKPYHRWRDMRTAFSTEAVAKEPSQLPGK